MDFYFFFLSTLLDLMMHVLCLCEWEANARIEMIKREKVPFFAASSSISPKKPKKKKMSCKKKNEKLLLRDILLQVDDKVCQMAKIQWPE